GSQRRESFLEVVGHVSSGDSSGSGARPSHRHGQGGGPAALSARRQPRQQGERAAGAMIVVVVLVLLAVLGFIAASVLFGSDSRSADSRCALPDWPGVRHSS
ncbi:MAG TPA: hypothetical protein VKJ07_03285, partial [Mycobacteriales bacterium]|nr:hypothetical protein [Mycobacteriales bacterium]